MNNRQLLVLVLFMLQPFKMFAVDSSKVSLQIINSNDSSGVAYAGILNYSQQLSSITDSSGRAELEIQSGDTLVLQCMGYLMKKYIVSAETVADTIIIALEMRNYEIEEVRYLHFRDYSAFKKAVLELEMPETELERLQTHINRWSVRAGEEGYETYQQNSKLASGFGVGVGIPSKDDIERAKLKKIVQKEARWETIARKYNRSIVQEITQFKDDELTDFMLFCGFDEDFLYTATQAEIALRIMQRLNAYRKMKDDSWFQSEINGFWTLPLA